MLCVLTAGVQVRKTVGVSANVVSDSELRQLFETADLVEHSGNLSLSGFLSLVRLSASLPLCVSAYLHLVPIPIRSRAVGG